MERPARRNLFDDSEEEDEDEYQPKPETIEDADKRETTMANAEEPVEGQPAEEGKEEGAIALN